MKPEGIREDSYVCHHDGKPLDDRELLQKVLRPAAEALGYRFPGFGWHTFRRMHLTAIQEEGATTCEAMAQAGHSRPSMTHNTRSSASIGGSARYDDSSTGSSRYRLRKIESAG